MKSDKARLRTRIAADGMDYKGYWRNAAGIYAVKGL